MNGFLHIRLFPFCQYWQNTDGGNCIRRRTFAIAAGHHQKWWSLSFLPCTPFCVYLLLLLLDAGSIAKQVDSIGRINCQSNGQAGRWQLTRVSRQTIAPFNPGTSAFLCVWQLPIFVEWKKKVWAREINATDQIRFSILPRNVLDNFALGSFSFLRIDEKVRWYWISCRRTHEASCKKRKLNFTKYDLPSGALLLLALTWKKSKRIWNWYTYILSN